MLVAQAWDRELSSVTALAVAAKVDATGHGDRDTTELFDAELALVLRRTDNELAYELSQARRLVSLPVMHALLRDGAVTPRHASSLVSLTERLDPQDAAEVDAQVSHRAATMTASGFRRVVRKLAAKLDRRTPEERARARKPLVGARLYPREEGLVALTATMPAADGIAALAAINARADASRTTEDSRLHGERQVDALLAALLGGGECARRNRTTKEVQVVIDWRSLVGLRDDPGELRGYGPIPADDVRSMIRDDHCFLRRLVVDDMTGLLVDYGRTRYQPDAFLRGVIAARDVTCRYPGCTANALWCDDEHCIAYDDGGPTSASNCCLMCRRHHRRKTFDGFSYDRPDPQTGETTWTTPLGFTYTQRPASYDESGCDPGDTFAESSPDPPPF